jgi:hypothetical protein
MYSTVSKKESGESGFRLPCRNAWKGARKADRALPVLLVCALSLCLGGCLNLSMTPPDGFLVVAESRLEVKAASSDSALLWVRAFDDRHDGDLDFWTDALFNDYVDNRGYVLIEKNPIQAGDVKGEEMFFETNSHGALQKYLVSLFVVDGVFGSTICVAEFVARSGPFETHLDAVRRAVTTLKF